MVAFISGVHGVGKTYLCEKYVELKKDVIHKSSSALIKQAKNGANWSLDKRVDDAGANQIALTQEVNKITSLGNKLILDGHTVLLDKKGEFIYLSASVFSQLGIKLIVLIEAPIEKIVQRIKDRDATKNITDIERFMLAERRQSETVSNELAIPLKILCEPSVQEFSEVIDEILLK